MVNLIFNVDHVHGTSPHQLTVNEIPAHQHGYNAPLTLSGIVVGTEAQFIGQTAAQTDLIGGSNSHTHGDTDSALNNVNFQMRYINAIRCVKS